MGARTRRAAHPSCAASAREHLVPAACPQACGSVGWISASVQISVCVWHGRVRLTRVHGLLVTQHHQAAAVRAEGGAQRRVQLGEQPLGRARAERKRAAGVRERGDGGKRGGERGLGLVCRGMWSRMGARDACGCALLGTAGAAQPGPAPVRAPRQLHVVQVRGAVVAKHDACQAGARGRRAGERQRTSGQPRSGALALVGALEGRSRAPTTPGHSCMCDHTVLSRARRAGGVGWGR